MSHDEEKGAAKQVKGKIKETAGDLTGNKKWQAEGKAEKTEGEIQEGVGKLKRKIDKDVL